MQNTAGMALMLAIIASGVSVWIALGQTFLAPAPMPAATATAPAPTADVAEAPPVGATWRKYGARPTATIAATSGAPNPTPEPSPSATPLVASPTPVPATATAEPTFTPSAEASPTVAPSGRAPWILLPAPPPGGRVAAGQVVVEARGRGEAPIAAIHLELDGVPLPVQLEQRSASIWRGSATVAVPPGQHEVRASVVDTSGRTGSYRWRFEATR